MRFDAAAVKRSAFFEGFEWMALLSQALPSPLEITELKDPFDTSQFDPYEFDEGRSGEEGEAGEGKGNDRLTEHGVGTSGLRNERKSCGLSRTERRIYRIVRFLREPELFQHFAAGPVDATLGQFGWY